MFEKKIIFMGTPNIAADFLNLLLENKYNIVSTFTQPARKKNRGMNIEISPVEKLSKINKILVHSPHKLDEETCDLIKSYEPDLIIVMAYGLLIPNEILEYPKFGFINVHLSLLPRWRGASPIEHVLLSNDKKTGVSIFKLVERLDAGPILAKEEILLDINLNKESLTERLTKLGFKMLLDLLPKLFAGNTKLTVQNENYATYAKKINSKMRKIDFNKTVKEVYNHIRAYSPKPGAWFIYNKERIKIISAKLNVSKTIPETIVNHDFGLGCIDGFISPLYIQREGKKIVHINEFLKGYSFKVGDKLNE